MWRRINGRGQVGVAYNFPAQTPTIILENIRCAWVWFDDRKLMGVAYPIVGGALITSKIKIKFNSMSRDASY